LETYAYLIATSLVTAMRKLIFKEKKTLQCLSTEDWMITCSSYRMEEMKSHGKIFNPHFYIVRKTAYRTAESILPFA
jgi:hypothetical protein